MNSLFYYHVFFFFCNFVGKKIYSVKRISINKSYKKLIWRHKRTFHKYLYFHCNEIIFHNANFLKLSNNLFSYNYTLVNYYSTPYRDCYKTIFVCLIKSASVTLAQWHSYGQDNGAHIGNSFRGISTLTKVGNLIEACS